VLELEEPLARLLRITFYASPPVDCAMRCAYLALAASCAAAAHEGAASPAPAGEPNTCQPRSRHPFMPIYHIIGNVTTDAAGTVTARPQRGQHSILRGSYPSCGRRRGAAGAECASYIAVVHSVLQFHSPRMQRIRCTIVVCVSFSQPARPRPAR
jgi:hypothetical protein